MNIDLGMCFFALTIYNQFQVGGCREDTGGHDPLKQPEKGGESTNKWPLHSRLSSEPLLLSARAAAADRAEWLGDVLEVTLQAKGGGSGVPAQSHGGKPGDHIEHLPLEPEGIPPGNSPTYLPGFSAWGDLPLRWNLE